MGATNRQRELREAQIRWAPYDEAAIERAIRANYVASHMSNSKFIVYFVRPVGVIPLAALNKRTPMTDQLYFRFEIELTPDVNPRYAMDRLQEELRAWFTDRSLSHVFGNAGGTRLCYE